MELVYLWVEEYKNIKNQGFNFSPRFECSYDGKNLNINEKEDYVDIFPNNINITAIVGENGSGKSALITEIINNIIFNTKTEYKRKAPIMCFLNDDKNKIYIYSNLIQNNLNIVSKFDFKLTHTEDETKRMLTDIDENFKKEYYRSFFYLYNNSLEIDYDYHHTYEYNPELLLFSEVDKSDNIINLEKESDKTYSYLITLLLNQKRVPKQIKNFFVPTRLFLNREILISYFKGKYEDEEMLFHKRLETNPNPKETLILETLLYLKYFMKNFNVLHEEDMKENIEILFENKDILKTYNEIYSSLKSDIEKYLTGINFIKKNIRVDDNKSNDIKELNELEKILKLLQDNDKLISLIKKPNNNPNDLDYEIDIELLDEDRLLFLKQMPSYLKIDFANKTGRKFDELSSGEKNLLKLMFSIENMIQKRIGRTDSLYILLDEIENTFHPDWQKRLLNWLIEFVKHYEMQINIIVATHAPYILSDLPKENVIFLEKYTKKEIDNKHLDQQVGNCKNATKNVNINPFGANIHTLLSHGFFMEDGLMGEFAKGKINDVYDFLTNLNTQIELTQEKAQNIINLIGEPILKKELQNLYDERYEVDEIDKQIREHQEAIEKLEALRNKND